jgi:DNA-binding NtrC family response regulator
VLLAEDDDAMRLLLARVLRRAGFEVVAVGSGYEVLERLAQGFVVQPPAWFDLVISDVRMPGYDGFNVLASIQQLSTRIPVILITAFGDAAAHATAARLGAFAMFDKPFDCDDLVTLARTATGAVVPGEDPP